MLFLEATSNTKRYDIIGKQTKEASTLQFLRNNLRVNLVNQNAHNLDSIESVMCNNKSEPILDLKLKAVVKTELKRAVHMVLNDHLLVSVYVLAITYIKV